MACHFTRCNCQISTLPTSPRSQLPSTSTSTSTSQVLPFSTCPAVQQLHPVSQSEKVSEIVSCTSTSSRLLQHHTQLLACFPLHHFDSLSRSNQSFLLLSVDSKFANISNSSHCILNIRIPTVIPGISHTHTKCLNRVPCLLSAVGSRSHAPTHLRPIFPPPSRPQNRAVLKTSAWTRKPRQVSSILRLLLPVQSAGARADDFAIWRSIP